LRHMYAVSVGTIALGRRLGVPELERSDGAF
jgi:hypothetical protein